VAQVTRRNKALRVDVNGLCSDTALVDLCLTDDLWIGSRALWKPEKIKEIFVAFAEVDAIGWSAVAGLIHPVSRKDSHGLHVKLCLPGKGQRTIYAPIAPGLVLPVGVDTIETLNAGEKHPVTMSRGVIALDGERELMFSPDQQVNIWLDLNGPLTVDIYKVLQIAAERNLLCDLSPWLMASKR
jgi:predicted polyphosphate/ATP-dependent NAD kinase